MEGVLGKGLCWTSLLYSWINRSYSLFWQVAEVVNPFDKGEGRAISGLFMLKSLAHKCYR